MPRKILNFSFTYFTFLEFLLNMQNVHYFMAIMIRVLLSLVSFMITMCYADWLISDSNYKPLLMHKMAFEFRTSHYFITFMSEAFAIASGLGYSNNEAEVVENKEEYISVSKPLSIEFPRSLIEIVVFWNIPMHKWFQNYVFIPTRSFGKFPSIFCTYLVSSLLHGLNYQLSAVLLSLAFYTYIEYMFRVKLSVLLNACLLAKPCKPDCRIHKYKSDRWAVFFVNFILGLMALYHLNYFGYLIDVHEEELNFYQSFQKWVHVGFSSHLLVTCTFLIYVMM